MVLDQFNLEGKVAIVTGASQGLGQAMALALAEAGADIVGVSHSGNPSTGKLVEQLGRRYLNVKANLMSMDAIPDIINASIQAFGHIDILVNNAGIIRRQEALEFSEKDWDDVMDINLKTVFFLSQQVAKVFKEQGHGGKIINIASMLSYQGGVNTASYTASKSAISGITRLLANEWAKDGIHVNGLAPGYMATDNTKDLRQDDDRSEAILERIPQGRWGTAEDLKGPIVFLASEASNYMNGFTMAVDGGWLAR